MDFKKKKKKTASPRAQVAKLHVYFCYLSKEQHAVNTRLKCLFVARNKELFDVVIFRA